MGTASGWVGGRSNVLLLERRPLVPGIIWTIIVILVVLWLLGFAIHIGGSLIHLLLVIAVVLVLFNLITGRGARV